jgi:hypothetical protein
VRKYQYRHDLHVTTQCNALLRTGRADTTARTAVNTHTELAKSVLVCCVYSHCSCSSSSHTQLVLLLCCTNLLQKICVCLTAAVAHQCHVVKYVASCTHCSQLQRGLLTAACQLQVILLSAYKLCMPCVPLCTRCSCGTAVKCRAIQQHGCSLMLAIAAVHHKLLKQHCASCKASNGSH